VRFQVAELRRQIEALPGGIEDGHLSPASRATLAIHTELTITEPEAMTTETLRRLGRDVGALAGLLADAYFV
jgi:uncharacterized alpha-E superfamily protein